MWVGYEYLAVLSESGLRRKGFLQKVNDIKSEGNMFLCGIALYVFSYFPLKRLSNEL